MAQQRKSPIRLELDLDADQPGLLEGLGIWLELGLISQEQVKALCESQLVCALPLVPVVQAVQPEVAQADLDGGSLVTGAAESASGGSAQDFLPPDFSADPPSRPRRPAVRPATTRRSPRPANPWLQQLMGELSVVWLLGLGVFLVVLSSAVLAATQWAQFSAVGQYLVLFAYTSAFWGIGQWSATNARLQLTSKTLQIISLLLVPLNLWAIDGLGVGNTGTGWLVGAIALLLLSAMAWWVLNRWATPLERGLNFLGLTYLQLGWAGSWMPLVAVYGGSAGSAVVTLYRQRQGQPRTGETARVSRLSLLLVLFGLGLLLLRALSVLEGNDWGQLGLAFGLYGAPLVWLGQQAEAERLLLPVPPNSGEAAPATSSQNRPLARWGLWGGRALLWWGWLLAISEWPAQALGIGLLGLGLRLWLLCRLERRWDLLCTLAIALQVPFLLWEMLPAGLRTALVTPLARWTETTDMLDSLLGVSLLPYVVGLVVVADVFYRKNNRKLAQFSESSALVLGSILTTISLASAPLLVINLIASTVTALIATLRRQPLQRSRVYLVHALALMTVVVTIADRWPALSATGWTLVAFGLMAVDLLLSGNRRTLWQESAWDLGRLLAGLAYLLLLTQLLERDFQSGLSLLGLSIPLVLLLVRGYSTSVLALGLTAPLTLGLPWTRLVGLGMATALAATNSYFIREEAVAMLTLGFGLGSVVSLLHDGVPTLVPNNTYWYLVGAIATLLLWLVWRWLPVQAQAQESGNSLRGIYGAACDRWGFILTGVILLGLTLESGLLYADLRPPYGAYVGALVMLAGAIVSRFWRQPQPLAVYSLGWTVELLVIEGLRWQDGTVLTLAAANLGLGVLTLGLALGLRGVQTRRDNFLSLPDLISPLRHLALIYALLAVGLRASDFTAWTGWIILGASLIALEVGRQARRPWLRWLALAGVSLGWYELVLYQLSRASGGYPSDGLVVLAAVALLIMLAYRLSASLLDRRLALPEAELLVAAHTHWGIGSLLMLLSAGAALVSGGLGLPWLALAVGLAFVGYALWQGRSPGSLETQSLWIYLGLAELVGWVAYLRLAFPALRGLDDWWGAVACGVAVALYWLPWSQWGWPQQPWRRMAVGVPLTILLITGGLDHVPSLWIAAGFYGWLAWSSRRLRLSYLSAGLIVWAVWVWLETQAIYDSVAFVAPVGLALLYGAEVDPAFREPANREARHWFRVVGSGLILGVALFSERWTGLPVGIVSLAAIALGLVARTRAYLYVGTVVFGLNAVNQLIVLNADYPFIKWVIGIVVGIGLIWVAADFERRRDQWLSLAQGWVQELNRWA
ncbi:MAG TPA: hypothetical protein V6D07_08725 [Trichocoleus sp.]